MQGHLLSIRMRSTGVTAKARAQHFVSSLEVSAAMVVNRPRPGRAGLDQLSHNARMKHRCSRGAQNPGFVRAGFVYLCEGLSFVSLRLFFHAPDIRGGNGGLG